MVRAHALLPAAGAGDRARTPVNKVLVPLAGVPVIIRTLRRFDEAPSICGVVVVGRRGETDTIAELACRFGIRKLAAVVEGGATRFESVRNGLAAIPDDADIIAVHDAARPFVTVEAIEESIRLAVENGSAVAAVPITDTVKRVGERLAVAETLPRETLYAVQTPQTFRASLLRRAYANASAAGPGLTDDAAVVESLGEPVYLFGSRYENLKLTTPLDFKIAEYLLARGGPHVA